MSKVSYNQSGYVGSSMSVRAMEAYEAGERPKSRWTKALMLDAISDACRDAERVMLPEVAKLRKDEVFSRFFVVTSWHHTSKYANATDFYGVDEAAVEEASRPMTGVELDELRTERAAAEARAKAEGERARRERESARMAARAEGLRTTETTRLKVRGSTSDKVPAAVQRTSVQMKWSDFKKFRTEVVYALAEHPEWRKTKRHPYDLAPTVIPNSPKAKTYWRIRNGTKGFCRQKANLDEEAALRLGSAYCKGVDFEMDESDARTVKKWMREFSKLNDKSEEDA